jgi:hypothetical protein
MSASGRESDGCFIAGGEVCSEAGMEVCMGAGIRYSLSVCIFNTKYYLMLILIFFNIKVNPASHLNRQKIHYMTARE